MAFGRSNRSWTPPPRDPRSYRRGVAPRRGPNPPKPVPLVASSGVGSWGRGTSPPPAPAPAPAPSAGPPTAAQGPRGAPPSAPAPVEPPPYDVPTMDEINANVDTVTPNPVFAGLPSGNTEPLGGMGAGSTPGDLFGDMSSTIADMGAPSTVPDYGDNEPTAHPSMPPGAAGGRGLPAVAGKPGLLDDPRIGGGGGGGGLLDNPRIGGGGVGGLIDDPHITRGAGGSTVGGLIDDPHIVGSGGGGGGGGGSHRGLIDDPLIGSGGGGSGDDDPLGLRGSGSDRVGAAAGAADDGGGGSDDVATTAGDGGAGGGDTPLWRDYLQNIIDTNEGVPSGEDSFQDVWEQHTDTSGDQALRDQAQDMYDRHVNADPYSQGWQDQHQGALDAQQAMLDPMLDQTYADEALAGRRAAGMNAAMGRGMGGGFGGAMAQTALGGMQARQKAHQAHQAQRLGMMEGQTQRLFGEAGQRRGIGTQMEAQELARRFNQAQQREQRGVDLKQGEAGRQHQDRMLEYKTGLDMKMSMMESMFNEAQQKGDHEAQMRIQQMMNDAMERSAYIEGVLGSSPGTLGYLDLSRNLGGIGASAPSPGGGGAGDSGGGADDSGGGDVYDFPGVDAYNMWSPARALRDALGGG